MSNPIPITRAEMNGAPKQRQAKVTGDVVPMPGTGTMIYCSVSDETGKLIGSAHVWVKNKLSAQPLIGGLVEIINKNASDIIS